MRKTITLLTIILVLLFSVLSCKNETQAPGSDNSGSLPSVDNASVTILKRMHVKAGQSYTLEGNYTLKDGIVLGTADSSREAGTSGDNLLTTCDGNKMPLPDKDNKISFRPEDIGISNEGDIFIGKYRQADDLTITAQEMEKKNVHGYYDEYYYVDLNDPKWADLDKSDIVVRLTSHPGDGYYSILKDERILHNYRGAFDVTDKDGFGIYMYTHRVQGFNYIPDCKIHITNPVDLEYGNDISIKKLFSVLRVPAADDSSDYCITVHGLSAETVKSMACEYYFTKNDEVKTNGGQYVSESGIIPYFIPEDGKIIFYVGQINKSFLMNLDFEPYYTKLSEVDAKVRIEKNNYPPILSYENYIDLSEAKKSPIKIKATYGSSDYITIPMKLTTTLTAISDEGAVKGIETMGHFWSGYSTGIFKLPFTSEYSFKDTPWVGYIVVDTKGKHIEKDTVLFTIKPQEVQSIKSGHSYKYVPGKVSYWNGQYECSLHNDGQSFLGVELNGDAGKLFSSGKFACDQVVDGMGTLILDNGWLSSTDTKFTRRRNGQTSESRAYKSGSNDNVNIQFEIDEIRYLSETDKSMKGKLVIVENKTEKIIDNVVFTYQP